MIIDCDKSNITIHILQPLKMYFLLSSTRMLNYIVDHKCIISSFCENYNDIKKKLFTRHYPEKKTTPFHIDKTKYKQIFRAKTF